MRERSFIQRIFYLSRLIGIDFFFLKKIMLTKKLDIINNGHNNNSNFSTICNNCVYNILYTFFFLIIKR